MNTHDDIHAHRILILDFGSQYTQLIARRVREIGVYCEIYPWDVEAGEIRSFRPKGIILSGGPETVTGDAAPRAPDLVFELGLPLLGICYGMQAAVVEFARSELGITDATTTEYDANAPNPVISLMEEQKAISQLGGTMRLGGQDVTLLEGSLAAKAYGKTHIVERHRHRYEVNNNYRDQLTEAGLTFSGLSVDDLVEMVEIEDHPFFLASQFHPEFTSNPRDGHPLFKSFIAAVRARADVELPEAVEA